MLDQIIQSTSGLTISPQSSPTAEAPLLGDEFSENLPTKIKELNFPKIPSTILNIESLDATVIDDFVPPSPPAAASVVLQGSLQNLDKLTTEPAKVVYKATIQLIGCHKIDYLPGDSLSLLCPNSDEVVSWLLSSERLDLGTVADADSSCRILSAGPKPLPHWLLPNRVTSVRQLLTECCELHVPVTKRITRLFAEYCLPSRDPDSRQKIRLLQLSSREGAVLFDRCIRQTQLTLLDLFTSFPACRIPVERILEILPRLQPRSYTLINLAGASSSTNSQLLSFIFTRVDFPGGDPPDDATGLKRYPRKHGVCSGYLERLWEGSISHYSYLRLYLRKNLNQFYLPTNESQPIIMVAAGTGIAPFLSFIQFESSRRQQDSSTTHRPLWLIFGCRSPLTSLLSVDEISEALSSGILDRCCLCFSRYKLDSTNPKLPDTNLPATLISHACLHPLAKYVQDCIGSTTRQEKLIIPSDHDKEVIDWIINRNACVMVCGEKQSMGPAVLSSVTYLISLGLLNGVVGESGRTLNEHDVHAGEAYVKQMRTDRRYLQDLWV